MNVQILLAAIALTAVAAYLIGSFSFAVIVSKLWAGDDVRRHGSGNAGMTNILRTFGKAPAVLCALGDLLKGIGAVLLGRWIFARLGVDVIDGGYLAGLFAVIGHLFPLYFGFKGGKGVLTAFAAAVTINPICGSIALATFLIVFLLRRMVSLASIVACVLYPVVLLVYQLLTDSFDLFALIMMLVYVGLILFMHRTNIKRIRNNTEHVFPRK